MTKIIIVLKHYKHFVIEIVGILLLKCRTNIDDFFKRFYQI